MHFVVRAGDEDLAFAHDLTRANMARFYATHGRIWDRTIFESSWPHTENFAIFEDEKRVGILRLSQEADALYIRDLQVVPGHQGRGAGSFALRFAERLAEERGVARLRLSVFSDNRAVALYRRIGFHDVGGDADVLTLEKAWRGPNG